MISIWNINFTERYHDLCWMDKFFFTPSENEAYDTKHDQFPRFTYIMASVIPEKLTISWKLMVCWRRNMRQSVWSILKNWRSCNSKKYRTIFRHHKRRSRSIHVYPIIFRSNIWISSRKFVHSIFRAISSFVSRLYFFDFSTFFAWPWYDAIIFTYVYDEIFDTWNREKRFYHYVWTKWVIERYMSMELEVTKSVVNAYHTWALTRSHWGFTFSLSQHQWLVSQVLVISGGGEHLSYWYICMCDLNHWCHVFSRSLNVFGC